MTRWIAALIVSATVAACTATADPVTIVRTDTLRIRDTVRIVDTVSAKRTMYAPVLAAQGLGGESGHLVAMTADAEGALVAGQRGLIQRMDGSVVADLTAYLPNPPTGFGGLFNVVAHQGRVFVFYSTTDSLAVVAELVAGVPQPLITSARYRVQHYGGGLDAAGDYLYAAFGDGQHFQGEGETSGLFGRLVRVHLTTLAVDTIARGLRSPWKIDVAGDSVWIADTGAFLWEEINRVAVTDRSVHLGWPHQEGLHCHVSDCSPYRPPLLTYPTAAFGCSAVVGGVVWRGRYWYTDFCEAWFRSTDGADVYHEFDLPGQVIGFGTVGERLYVLGYQGGRVWEVTLR